MHCPDKCVPRAGYLLLSASPPKPWQPEIHHNNGINTIISFRSLSFGHKCILLKFFKTEIQPAKMVTTEFQAFDQYRVKLNIRLMGSNCELRNKIKTPESLSCYFIRLLLRISRIKDGFRSLNFLLVIVVYLKRY